MLLVWMLLVESSGSGTRINQINSFIHSVMKGFMLITPLSQTNEYMHVWNPCWLFELHFMSFKCRGRKGVILGCTRTTIGFHDEDVRVSLFIFYQYLTNNNCIYAFKVWGYGHNNCTCKTYVSVGLYNQCLRMHLSMPCEL